MAEFSSSGEFGQVLEPNRIIGVKQVCSHQSLPEEHIGAEFQMEVQNNTIVEENQVVKLFEDDLGSLDNLIDKPVQASNVILDGMSSDTMYVKKVDSEARPDNAKVKRNVEGKNDAIDSSQLEGAQMFPVEQMEVMHSDLSKNCGSIEENECGDSSQMEGAQISLVEQVGILHSDLSKNCGKIAENECGDPSLVEGALISSIEQVEILHGNLSKNCGKIQENECGDSSLMEGAQISPVELVEVLHNDLSRNCGEIEENECDDSSQMEGAQISPVEQMEVLHSDVSEKCGKIEEKECGDSSLMEGVQISPVEPVEILHGDLLKNCGKIEENECGACEANTSPIEQSTPPSSEKRDEKLHVVVLGVPVPDACEKPRRGRKPKKNNPEQLSVATTRALRSRSKENSKDPEPSVNLETTKGCTGKKGRKKGKEKDGKSNNEFARMRKHLRYLLHRIQYEQNLLDAYSSEGWRGQSIEKLRPEKELQRAKADINRSKLKIRDLFQRLASMSAEGKFPESLFDCDGLIDSEDIFCAKCGSKDLSTGNDILLCDGICDRGFHQYCLDPPLRTEEIPPGDEGWLCPACDCKADCIDLLNDSHGTKLAIEDSWEKVFPEAVAAADGKELDDIMGLPSDDSEDNEYNPDGSDDDANAEGNESSSEESNADGSDTSDFSSASEDLGAINGADKNLGLPSDDSEDDDFDPDAATVNEDGVEHESSSSDFTSASEDLGAAIDDEGISDKHEPPLPLELEQDIAESSPITGKRCLERLDYKKLYDETYGTAASDSSDDEEWTEMVATRKRKSSTEKTVLVLGVSAADGTCGSGTPRRRGRPKVNRQVANGSPVQVLDSSQKTSSAGSSKKRPPYKRLGESVTKRLYESFKENQYPDRETKEKLAKEVGLTAHRVDKWFGNARWSFNHHPSRVEASMSRAVSHSNTPHNVSCNGGESVVVPDSECGNADTSKLDETSTKKSTPRRSKRNTQDQAMLETSEAKNSKEGSQTDPLQEPEIPQGRLQRKRRKSGA